MLGKHKWLYASCGPFLLMNVFLALQTLVPHKLVQSLLAEGLMQSRLQNSELHRPQTIFFSAGMGARNNMQTEQQTIKKDMPQHYQPMQALLLTAAKLTCLLCI
jgi:hypothetical protein